METTDRGASPLFLRENELREGMALLYFAWRDLSARSDKILEDAGLGRAHHRVIYIVGQQPDISVKELLSVLKITKQSLARVLRCLVSEGYVHNQTCDRDRRRRLLRLTDKGQELEARLTDEQLILLGRAWREAGADAVEGYRRVLIGLINDDDRRRVVRTTA